MAGIYLSLLFIHLLNEPLKHVTVKSKIFRKSSLNFSFGQDSYLMPDFAWTNSIKSVWLQTSLRSEIVIFNNYFAFCQTDFLKSLMVSFCGML